MSNSQKYYLSAFFVFAALLAIAYSSQESVSEAPLPDVYTNQHLVIDYGFDFQSLLVDANLTANDDPAIISVMAMSPKTCTPCINNVADLKGAIDSDEDIQPLVLFFTNEPEWRVSHFVQTSGLDISYILKNTEDKLLAAEPMQHILFLDSATKQLFYIEHVPNITTPYEAKVELLTRVKQTWSGRYKHVNEPSAEN